MKTITISVDDETYRLYQSRAEATGVSVEEWAGDKLASLSPKPISDAEAESRRRQMGELLARIEARREAEGREFRPGKKLTRDELHDRNALR